MAQVGGGARIPSLTPPLLRKAEFPNLTWFAETSDPTMEYNCHAWGLDHNDFWLEPCVKRPATLPPWCKWHWPDGIPRGDYSLGNFRKAYRTLGYIACKGGEPESGYEKVAIYVRNGKVTHTARQLPSGNWTSKMGTDIDIEHESPAALEGPKYGEVKAYMKRTQQATKTPGGALYTRHTM